VASATLQLTVMFSVFSLCLGNEDILKSFKFDRPSNFVYLFLFQMLYSPTSLFTKFASMYMIRQCEYQADNFAIKYGHGENLKKSLTTLFVRNKGALTADPLYSAYNHSHPTLLERL